ncbi:MULTISPECIES: TetR/AcrR family transcriptional regulator [Streptomyces]|uniref:TetR/AcrR family transcriptional regulator n=1 Tax=Streptomyces TaxID=1883 RepID=UPI0004C8432C|nr:MULTISPECIES: TetR/AcrR family transcriptional regulator [unclassified Streptomyces]SEB61815.1 transcriptional regulator, TetR family [Streptomyces sp. PAN_FS17]SEE31834.1 transcriptional regulator, TetR family [Streptomyces sp. KS_5]
MVGMQRDGAVRGRGRPREERVTGAVLTAVVDLVTEQGIGAVTMDAVATRAGVSKPAIYRRWPTKQDLIIAAAETRLGVLSVPDLGDFRAELRLVLTARLEAYRLPGSDRLIAGLIGVAAEAGAARGQYAEYTERITSETRRILERGMVRGDVDPDTDVRAAATLVAAPLIFRLIGEQEMPDARFVETLVELVARAVGPTG